MCSDMLFVHSRICGRMYTRKASDDHRPSIIILDGEWLFMKSAIAAPDRRDRLPICSGEKPKVEVPPKRVQQDLRSCSVNESFMVYVDMVVELKRVQSRVFELCLGTNRITRNTARKRRRTGQRVESAVRR